MRKSKFFVLLGMASIALSVSLFTACHKKTDTAEDTSYANDHAVSEKSFEDVQTVADEAAVSPNGSFSAKGTSTGSPCATVTHTVNATGDSVILINFPDSTCVCRDGSFRYGQIIVTYSGAYAVAGSTHTISFNNFYQNSNQVIGTKTVTNMGLNSSGQTYFDVTINGSVILAHGAGTVSPSWNRVRTWITQGTPNIYQVTGTGTLTRANGTTVAVNIPTATPLVVSSACRWIEAGTVIYTLPSGLTRTLNYGNTANCDAEATLTLPSGVSYNITMK